MKIFKQFWSVEFYHMLQNLVWIYSNFASPLLEKVHKCLTSKLPSGNDIQAGTIFQDFPSLALSRFGEFPKFANL